MENKKKTKSEQEIKLRSFNIDEDIQKSRLFDTFVIQALINDEVVGYVKLTQISKEKAKKLIEPFDYFIYKIYASNETLISAYEQNDYKTLLSKLALRTLNLSQEKLESMSKSEVNQLYYDYKNLINKDYETQFKSFYDYWVNKPNIELIKVFSDEEKTYTDYFIAEHPQVERKNLTNWRGQGVGAALYEDCIDWCDKQGLCLWASLTRTDDAKKMWQLMEKMPKFTMIMTEVCKYSTQGEVIQRLERPKIHLT